MSTRVVVKLFKSILILFLIFAWQSLLSLQVEQHHHGMAKSERTQECYDVYLNIKICIMKRCSYLYINEKPKNKMAQEKSCDSIDREKFTSHFSSSSFSFELCKRKFFNQLLLFRFCFFHQQR